METVKDVLPIVLGVALLILCGAVGLFLILINRIHNMKLGEERWVSEDEIEYHPPKRESSRWERGAYWSINSAAKTLPFPLSLAFLGRLHRRLDWISDKFTFDVKLRQVGYNVRSRYEWEVVEVRGRGLTANFSVGTTVGEESDL
jgi:hypothetical protein